MSIFEVSLFGFQIAPTWYGLMYAIGFFCCYEYVRKYGYLRGNEDESLLTYIFLWVIWGWRIGYVILYNLEYFIAHPLEIFAIWQWGMSFHGGALGVIIALFLFSWRKKYHIFNLSDPLVTILPLALGLGRIWNVINKELLGYSPYRWPFAIIKDWVSHFPSPLLEAWLEWILLLTLMFMWKKREWKIGRIPGYSSALFLWGYALFRLFSELFRLPDSHIGYLAGTHWLTLGMIYTLPMLIGSSIIVWIIHQRKKLS